MHARNVLFNQEALPLSVHLGIAIQVIHVIKWTRHSPSVFPYCKRSITGWWEGLGMRLQHDLLLFIHKANNAKALCVCIKIIITVDGYQHHFENHLHKYVISFKPSS